MADKLVQRMAQAMEAAEWNIYDADALPVMAQAALDVLKAESDVAEEPEARLGRAADQTIREMIRDEIERKEKNLPIRPYPEESQD